MFEVRPEGVRGKHVSREGEDLAEETASSEPLSWRLACHVQGTMGRPAWQAWSERGGGEVREATEVRLWILGRVSSGGLETRLTFSKPHLDLH